MSSIAFLNISSENILRSPVLLFLLVIFVGLLAYWLSGMSWSLFVQPGHLFLCTLICLQAFWAVFFEHTDAWYSIISFFIDTFMYHFQGNFKNTNQASDFNLNDTIEAENCYAWCFPYTHCCNYQLASHMTVLFIYIYIYHFLNYCKHLAWIWGIEKRQTLGSKSWSWCFSSSYTCDDQLAW